ncbi:MAG: sigma-70 family RNA polymerase sigma factor [Planctomycetes bacterium]|nr:sigma-70 family RNA polymerase sigma factor [Planctomycetota bacterium]
MSDTATISITINTYEGVLPLWAQELTQAYAKRLGYRLDEIDEGLQEVAIAFAKYRFDHTRNTGACERTAQTALIRNVLQKVLRGQVRYTQRLERLRAEPQRAEAGPDTVAQHELWQVVAAMPEPDREICLRLAAGMNIHAIAKELEIGWYTVKRAMERIKTSFAEAGIDSGLLA